MWFRHTRTTDREIEYKAQHYKQDGYIGHYQCESERSVNPTYHHYEDDIESNEGRACSVARYRENEYFD